MNPKQRLAVALGALLVALSLTCPLWRWRVRSEDVAFSYTWAPPEKAHFAQCVLWTTVAREVGAILVLTAGAVVVFADRRGEQ